MRPIAQRDPAAVDESEAAHRFGLHHGPGRAARCMTPSTKSELKRAIGGEPLPKLAKRGDDLNED